MTTTTKPTKEIVREFMQRRIADKTPPPTPERTREELGWNLIPHNAVQQR